MRDPNHKLAKKTDWYPYLLVAPVIVAIICLVAYPFVFSIYVSFTNRVIGNAGEWIGLENYRFLAGNATFRASITNTIVITFISIVLKFLIGLGLALLVTQRIPARGLVKSALLLPWAMPAFVAYLVWRVIYQPIGGGINLILTETGLYPYVIDWLGQRSTAMPSVIAAYVWRGFPFWFVSILAAIQSIPKELYEAARIDGANAWQRFTSVTLPGIKDVLVVTTLLSTIWTANGFEHVWLLTRGGPSDATIVFPVLSYLGLQSQQIGQAAAVSVAMLPVLAVLVFFATGYLQRDDER